MLLLYMETARLFVGKLGMIKVKVDSQLIMSEIELELNWQQMMLVASTTVWPSNRFVALQFLNSFDSVIYLILA